MSNESASTAGEPIESGMIGVSEWMRWNDIAMPVVRLRPPFDLGELFVGTTEQQPGSVDEH